MALKQLEKALGRLFAAQPKRKSDPFRRQREEAKALAREHAIEIEPLGGGFNVWPPKSFVGQDPFEGDHHCSDWDDVLTAVQRYAAGGAAITQDRKPRP